MSNGYNDPWPITPAIDRDRNQKWLRNISCSALQDYDSMRSEPRDTRLRVCVPLEYDEPDPAPDFDDDEWDDDEYGPIDALAESIRADGIEPRPA